MTAPWPVRARAAELWQTFRHYLGAGGRGRRTRINDRDGLRQFLESRASHVAQTSLYGYLRTRAGVGFPNLFDNDDYVKSIDIAKWYVWLACLSDISIYAGGLVMRRTNAGQDEVGRLMAAVVDAILTATGMPEGAGGEFLELTERLSARLESCDWAAVRDDETPFSESPGALISRAPVIDELKRLDDEIVRNSVRFRWQEVRRDLRRDLDAEALIASLGLANPRSEARRNGG
ncbi:MAG: esterase [Betaproteobacteria bacterium]|nr:esterase [Betaproteobacteria bacterium]MDH3437251.1 esterase [Betaproteobacteria bacterium]